MKTKSVWMMGSLVVCVAPLYAEPKSNVKPSPPVVVQPQIADGEIDYSNFDSGLVQPLPKSSSPFTVKPPDGTTYYPDLKAFVPGKKPNQKVHERIRIVPVFPDTDTNPNASPKQRGFRNWDSWLKAAKEWKVLNASLSAVLYQLKRSYSVKILMSSSPEQMFEDPGISMTLKGKTVEEKLDDLTIIGLFWRKNGDVYYVAWSKDDLPPTQNTLTPASQ